MVLAFSIFTHWSNVLVIILSGVVVLFLLKSINLRDKLWLASVVSIAIIALLSVGQIVSHNNLIEQLREKELALDTLKSDYAALKTETEPARLKFADAKESVSMSRRELDDLRTKVTAEFERTIREIRSVYANISDEELNRRFNNAVRKARQNFQNNVFQ
jgi:membrane-associated HD superfamily phosphohydrolase